jgi:hypothetical protein
LVDTGFLEQLPERRGERGAREKPYVTTGKSWRISGGGTSSVLLDTFLEEVQLVPMEQVDSTRLGLRLNAARLEELRNRLQDLFDEYAAAPDDADGQAWSLFLALHPDPNRAHLS